MAHASPDRLVVMILYESKLELVHDFLIRRPDVVQLFVLSGQLNVHASQWAYAVNVVYAKIELAYMLFESSHSRELRHWSWL
jgi:hypothetical protein